MSRTSRLSGRKCSHGRTSDPPQARQQPRIELATYLADLPVRLASIRRAPFLHPASTAIRRSGPRHKRLGSVGFASRALSSVLSAALYRHSAWLDCRVVWSLSRGVSLRRDSPFTGPTGRSRQTPPTQITRGWRLNQQSARSYRIACIESKPSSKR